MQHMCVLSTVVAAQRSRQRQVSGDRSYLRGTCRSHWAKQGSFDSCSSGKTCDRRSVIILELCGQLCKEPDLRTGDRQDVQLAMRARPGAELDLMVSAWITGVQLRSMGSSGVSFGWSTLRFRDPQLEARFRTESAPGSTKHDRWCFSAMLLYATLWAFVQFQRNVVEAAAEAPEGTQACPSIYVPVLGAYVSWRQLLLGSTCCCIGGWVFAVLSSLRSPAWHAQHRVKILTVSGITDWCVALLSRVVHCYLQLKSPRFQYRQVLWMDAFVALLAVFWPVGIMGPLCIVYCLTCIVSDCMVVHASAGHGTACEVGHVMDKGSLILQMLMQWALPMGSLYVSEATARLVYLQRIQASRQSKQHSKAARAADKSPEGASRSGDSDSSGDSRSSTSGSSDSSSDRITRSGRCCITEPSSNGPDKPRQQSSTFPGPSATASYRTPEAAMAVAPAAGEHDGAGNRQAAAGAGPSSQQQQQQQQQQQPTQQHEGPAVFADPVNGVTSGPTAALDGGDHHAAAAAGPASGGDAAPNAVGAGPLDVHAAGAVPPPSMAAASTDGCPGLVYESPLLHRTVALKIKSAGPSSNGELSLVRLAATVQNAAAGLLFMHQVAVGRTVCVPGCLLMLASITGSQPGQQQQCQRSDQQHDPAYREGVWRLPLVNCANSSNTTDNSSQNSSESSSSSVVRGMNCLSFETYSDVEAAAADGSLCAGMDALLRGQQPSSPHSFAAQPLFAVATWDSHLSCQFMGDIGLTNTKQDVWFSMTKQQEALQPGGCGSCSSDDSSSGGARHSSSGGSGSRDDAQLVRVVLAHNNVAIADKHLLLHQSQEGSGSSSIRSWQLQLQTPSTGYDSICIPKDTFEVASLYILPPSGDVLASVGSTSTNSSGKDGSGAGTSSQQYSACGPLATVTVVLLPPAAAAEFTDWLEAQGHSQQQLQPLLLDMAVAAEAVAKLTTAASAGTTAPSGETSAAARAAAKAAAGPTVAEVVTETPPETRAAAGASTTAKAAAVPEAMTGKAAATGPTAVAAEGKPDAAGLLSVVLQSMPLHYWAMAASAAEHAALFLATADLSSCCDIVAEAQQQLQAAVDALSDATQTKASQQQRGITGTATKTTAAPPAGRQTND